MQTVLDLTRNYLSFISEPKTKEEVLKNQQLRHEALSKIKAGPVAQEDRSAVKQFWATQTYFFVRLLVMNKDKLSTLLPAELFNSIDERNLTKDALKKLTSFIAKNLDDNEQFAKALIEIISNDCKLGLAGQNNSASSAQQSAEPTPLRPPFQQSNDQDRPLHPPQSLAASLEPIFSAQHSDDPHKQVKYPSQKSDAQSSPLLPVQLPVGQKQALLSAINVAPQSQAIIVPIDEASNTKPTLYIQNGNSIQFAYQQSSAGKKVIIMDASNQQRPGAAAYDTGTFQEALTRNTDLYWKFMVHFRNVLEELANKNQTFLKLSEEDKKIAVWQYQARFLRLIIQFIKESLYNENCVDNMQFNDLFFSFANKIYGEMQNIVFEIPTDGGFLKNCCIIDLGENVKGTADLFENDVFKSELLVEDENRVLIAEVAAPDKRKTEGQYDRGCTFNKTLRYSDRDDVADTMIANSFTYMLKEAINNQADIIVINAFGCKAFLNNPENVAKIFATVLKQHTQALSGKQIYFMDLNKDMCWRFGQILSDTLAGDFNINTYQREGVEIDISPTPLPVREPNEKEAFIVGFAKCHYGKRKLEFTKLADNKPNNRDSLRDCYYYQLNYLIKQGVNDVHTCLLGSGNLKMPLSNCVHALFDALQKLSSEGKTLPKIHLHIIDPNIYFTVISYLNGLQNTPSHAEELKRYYKIINPDIKRLWSFQGGRATSDFKNLIGKYDEYSKISEHLYLGRAPTQAAAKILKEKLGVNFELILPVTECYEVSGYGFTYLPIHSPLDFKEMGVEHHQLAVQDVRNANFPIRELAAAVRKIRKKVEENKITYVHCKAGISRSATVVFLYLLQYGSEPVNGVQELKPNSDRMTIFNYLKKLRPVISLHDFHFDAIYAAKKLLDNPEPIAVFNSGNLLKDINDYLADSRSKSAIAQMVWFKEIKKMAYRDATKLKCVQQFLDDLFQAKSTDKLCALFNKVDILKDAKIELYAELVQHLAVKLQQTKEEIDALLLKKLDKKLLDTHSAKTMSP